MKNRRVLAECKNRTYYHEFHEEIRILLNVQDATFFKWRTRLFGEIETVCYSQNLADVTPDAKPLANDDKLTRAFRKKTRKTNENQEGKSGRPQHDHN